MYYRIHKSQYGATIGRWSCELPGSFLERLRIGVKRTHKHTKALPVVDLGVSGSTASSWRAEHIIEVMIK